MKLSECLTSPGDVAVRQSDGAVAIQAANCTSVVFAGRHDSVNYDAPQYIRGDDWVCVWPETERIVQLREHVWRNAKLVSDCLEQVPGGLTNSMPIEKVPVEIANRIQELKARIAELENPTLGEPLPVGYVIPAGTQYFYRIQAGCMCSKVSDCDKVCREHDRPRWLDPRPMPKLPEPEPEPRYTVAMVDSSTPWVVRENGVTIGWHYTKADAERIARLLNERKGE